MKQLNEFDSKKLLEQYGICIPKGYFAKHENMDLMHNVNLAAIFIRAKQYVIKVVSADIPHKSDVGGVVLNVTPNRLAIEVNYMLERIKKNMPDAKIDGFYIQEMVESGVECIIGINEDPQFGKVIMFGLGGIYAEIFKDVSMRVLPITKEDAHEMITETKVYKILNGARGKHYDIKAITDILIKVSRMSDMCNIKELDINPLVVHEQGCKALDARILL
jgi:acyl-CoA synthetase (NDP forming)